jgi:hypothetical protein
LKFKTGRKDGLKHITAILSLLASPLSLKARIEVLKESSKVLGEPREVLKARIEALKESNKVLGEPREVLKARTALF